jgi:hypothetical protein
MLGLVSLVRSSNYVCGVVDGGVQRMRGPRSFG